MPRRRNKSSASAIIMVENGGVSSKHKSSCRSQGRRRNARGHRFKVNQKQEDDFSLLDFPLADITKSNNIKQCNADYAYAGQHKTLVALPTGNGPNCLAKVHNTGPNAGKRESFMENLPEDLIFTVLSYVGAKILANMSSISMRWRAFSKQKLSSILWTNLYSRQYASPFRGFFFPSTESDAPYSQDMKTLFFKRGVEEKTWMNFGHSLKYLKSGINVDLLSGREILQVGENKEFKNLHSAIAAASAFDKIVIFPGMYSSDQAIFISKCIEIVGLCPHPKDVVLNGSAIILRDGAKVRFSNISFLSPCISTPTMSNEPGWLQFDDCVLDHPQFVQLSGGVELGTLMHSSERDNKFAGAISRSLLNSPNFPSDTYANSYVRKDRYNRVVGEVQIGAYDVEFVDA